MNILISAGPMRTYIDPIRYVQNSSSGNMGAAIALRLKSQLPRITLTTLVGPVDSSIRQSYESISNSIQYQTPAEYERLLLEHFPKCDLFISCAAVLDFEIETASEKISRRSIEHEITLNLPKKTVRDFVAAMGNDHKKPHQRILAFALETGSEAQAIMRARDKIRAKNADWIFVNFASPRQGPDKPLSEGVILGFDGEIVLRIPEMSKTDVANALADFLISSTKT